MHKIHESSKLEQMVINVTNFQIAKAHLIHFGVLNRCILYVSFMLVRGMISNCFYGIFWSSFMVLLNCFVFYCYFWHLSVCVFVCVCVCVCAAAIFSLRVITRLPVIRVIITRFYILRFKYMFIISNFANLPLWFFLSTVYKIKHFTLCLLRRGFQTCLLFRPLKAKQCYINIVFQICFVLGRSSTLWYQME